MKNFSGGVAVITGGASGIGKEFAIQCAELGMKIMLADVQQDALDAAVESLNAKGAIASGLRVDVSSPSDVNALAEQTIRTFGKVNLVFNNAGVTSGGLVWEHSDEDWSWVLGVNLRGVINGMRSFTPLMLEQARSDPNYAGHVINTASMAGLITAPTMGIYSVSKNAVVALSEALYHDLSLVTDQVHCSVLCPSFVSTGISQSYLTRPEALSSDAPLTKSQTIARINSGNAVGSGDASPERVCQATFDAIRRQAFYVYPHPGALAIAKRRFDKMVAQENPSDPFEGVPGMSERRQRLVEALSA